MHSYGHVPCKGYVCIWHAIIVINWQTNIDKFSQIVDSTKGLHSCTSLKNWVCHYQYVTGTDWWVAPPLVKSVKGIGRLGNHRFCPWVPDLQMNVIRLLYTRKSTVWDGRLRWKIMSHLVYRRYWEWQLMFCTSTILSATCFLSNT